MGNVVGFRRWRRLALVCLVSLICVGCMGLTAKVANLQQEADARHNASLRAKTNATEESPGSKSPSTTAHTASLTPPSTHEVARSANGSLVSTLAAHSVTAARHGRAISNTNRARATHAMPTKFSGEQSEDDAVRHIALDLAEKNPSIAKIKVCYDSKEAEWWVILYQDAGPYYELKQYTWNIYRDEPEPFLVRERLSKKALKRHLEKKSTGLTCKILEPPRKRDWLAALADSKTWRSADTPEQTALQHPRKKSRRPTESRERSLRKPHGTKPAPVEKTDRRRARSVPLSAHTAHEPDSSAKIPGVHRRTPVEASKKSAGEGRTASYRAPDPVSAVAGQAPPVRHSPTLRRESPYRQALAHASPLNEAFKKAQAPARDVPSFRSASAGSTGLKIVPDRTPRVTLEARRGTLQEVPQESGQQPEKRSLSSVASRDKPSAQERQVPTYFVFAYGSKINHLDLLNWLKANGYDTSQVVDATPGVLEGYDFVWNYYSPSRGGGAVNLESKSNSRIWGLLIEIEDPLLKAFDQREGHPDVYSRGEHRVPVKRVQDGKSVFAWLYLAKPNRAGRRDIWPTESYKKKVVEAARFWGFPKQYIERIESWKTR